MTEPNVLAFLVSNIYFGIGLFIGGFQVFQSIGLVVLGAME